MLEGDEIGATDLQLPAAPQVPLEIEFAELLELSRVGRVVNESQVVPLGDLVDEVLELLDGVIRERGVTVKVQPDLPNITCDRPRMVEVLQNLVDNAVRFTETHVEVKLTKNPSHFFVRVWDDGPGIDPFTRH